MPIKDRSINIPPEKPDGEGWLANADQQKDRFSSNLMRQRPTDSG